MFENLHHPAAVQCVECGRYRVDGRWSPDRPGWSDMISHTVCPDCQPRLLDELRLESEFRSWSPLKRQEALRLWVQHVPMDESTLRRKLFGMGVTDPGELHLHLEDVSPFLVERLCPYCRKPIQESESTERRAGYLLHRECARNLTDSLHVLSDLSPSVQHLDAYMDVARIPHGVREGVRERFAS